MNELFRHRAKMISAPEPIGSYKKEDCIFLLKNINNLIEEQGNEEREGFMKDGTHYSEMLPIEYQPSKEYEEVFKASLSETAERIAGYIAYVSELILKLRGQGVVLVSLARAGSPIGVLIKRYIKEKYQIDLPHYSVSIIRGKGIDENALCYIVNKHNTCNLQFIDGWTGKGAINRELKSSISNFNKKYQLQLNDELAVLADPSKSVGIYGTREDFLIPSACLNSTVSGLISRTVERKDIIGEYDFHGAKFYKEWEGIDYSNEYICEISKFLSKSFHFENLEVGKVFNSGEKEVEYIQKLFGIEDINKVKPGVGETTRVLLRRVPWKILVDNLNNPNLKHILMLAKDKNVVVEEFNEMSYSCIGIIKE